MKILYISQLKNSPSNGVTVAVCQLLNSLCNYAEIALYNLSEFDFALDERIVVLNSDNWASFKADIAVFEDPFNTVSFCRIAHSLKARHIPYIISPHGCFTFVALQKHRLKKKLAINTLFRSFLNGCMATQFLCEDELKNSIHYGKSIILPNGVPYTNDYQIVEHVKNIVFISRKDIRHKGLDYLLDAVLLIKSFLEEHNISIYLYGSSESKQDDDYIDRFIDKHHLNSIVHNNGPIFGDRKQKVLMNSDLFILTSRHEGFPLSILEALSFGLPVLITDGTNMVDIVSNANAGWTCATDSNAIASSLISAIEAKDCREKSIKARALALKYSWDEISQQTLALYEKLLVQLKE